MNNNNVDKIICGNFPEIAAQLPDECVDLTITSPPHDSFPFQEVAKALYRITKIGGVVVWVVGDRIIEGSMSGNSVMQALFFKELGFLLHDTMLYEKSIPQFSAGRNGNRYTQVVEYMFVLSKNVKPKTAKLLCDKENRWAGMTSFGKATCRLRNGKLVERDNQGKITPEFSPRTNIWKYNTGKRQMTKDD